MRCLLFLAVTLILANSSSVPQFRGCGCPRSGVSAAACPFYKCIGRTSASNSPSFGACVADPTISNGCKCADPTTNTDMHEIPCVECCKQSTGLNGATDTCTGAYCAKAALDTTNPLGTLMPCSKLASGKCECSPNFPETCTTTTTTTTTSTTTPTTTTTQAPIAQCDCPAAPTAAHPCSDFTCTAYDPSSLAPKTAHCAEVAVAGGKTCRCKLDVVTPAYVKAPCDCCGATREQCSLGRCSAAASSNYPNQLVGCQWKPDPTIALAGKCECVEPASGGSATPATWPDVCPTTSTSTSSTSTTTRPPVTTQTHGCDCPKNVRGGVSGSNPCGSYTCKVYFPSAPNQGSFPQTCERDPINPGDANNGYNCMCALSVVGGQLTQKSPCDCCGRTAETCKVGECSAASNAPGARCVWDANAQRCGCQSSSASQVFADVCSTTTSNPQTTRTTKQTTRTTQQTTQTTKTTKATTTRTTGTTKTTQTTRNTQVQGCDCPRGITPTVAGVADPCAGYSCKVYSPTSVTPFTQTCKADPNNPGDANHGYNCICPLVTSSGGSLKKTPCNCCGQTRESCSMGECSAGSNAPGAPCLWTPSSADPNVGTCSCQPSSPSSAAFLDICPTTTTKAATTTRRPTTQTTKRTTTTTQATTKTTKKGTTTTATTKKPTTTNISRRPTRSPSHTSTRTTTRTTTRDRRTTIRPDCRRYAWFLSDFSKCYCPTQLGPNDSCGNYYAKLSTDPLGGYRVYSYAQCVANTAASPACLAPSQVTSASGANLQVVSAKCLCCEYTTKHECLRGAMLAEHFGCRYWDSCVWLDSGNGGGLCENPSHMPSCRNTQVPPDPAPATTTAPVVYQVALKGDVTCCATRVNETNVTTAVSQPTGASDLCKINLVRSVAYALRDLSFAWSLDVSTCTTGSGFCATITFSILATNLNNFETILQRLQLYLSDGSFQAHILAQTGVYVTCSVGNLACYETVGGITSPTANTGICERILTALGSPGYRASPVSWEFALLLIVAVLGAL